MTVIKLRPDLVEQYDGSGSIPMSDDDLALKFASKHDNELRHVDDWGQWYYWNESVWIRDDRLRVFDFARELCREESATLTENEQVKSLTSSRTVAAVVNLARCDRRLAAVTSQWDTHEFLLNTPDGIVDLTTGLMLDNVVRLGYYMTRITSVSPSRDGCPLFLQFLWEVTAGDQDLIDFLQRVFGYCLTGSTREHALFFCYGTGANGKSVLLNIISYILKDYWRAAPMEALTATNSDRHPTELAGLQGRRMVTAVETEQGRKWADAKIKQLTGGDPISARFMRQDFFEYMPQFKLVVAGNHKPGLRCVDEAAKRRINLIPFAVTIPPERRDKDLLNKLKAEAGGILRWMIDGCVKWQEQGLCPPAVVTEATKAYLMSEDALAAWIEDCCVIDDRAWEITGLLFASWKKWAQEAGEKELLSQKGFNGALDSRGVVVDPDKPKINGARVRFGMKLTDEAREDAEREMRKGSEWQNL
jgi:putative DNA primase/helicase